MPGLRGKQLRVDTTKWTVHSWNRARIGNIVFLVGWIVFFLCALVSLLSDRHWLMLVPTFMIAGLGSILQLVWLRRIAHRIKRKQH